MIAPDTTYTQTERLQQKTIAYLFVLPPADFCVWTMDSSRRISDLVAQELYSMQHLQGLNTTFLPQQSNFIQLYRRDHSPSSCLWMVPPTPFHLPIHIPGCLYNLPVLPRPTELCLQPPCPECCVDKVVLYRCLSDLAQLSFHWIPGHCNICPNQITDLLAKTGDCTSSSSLPLGLLVSAYP